MQLERIDKYKVTLRQLAKGELRYEFTVSGQSIEEVKGDILKLKEELDKLCQ